MVMGFYDFYFFIFLSVFLYFFLFRSNAPLLSPKKEWNVLTFKKFSYLTNLDREYDLSSQHLGFFRLSMLYALMGVKFNIPLL